MKDALKEVIEELDRLEKLDDILDMAVALEEQSRKFYLDKVSTQKNPGMNEIYKYLAGEEAKHAKYLKEFKQKNAEPGGITDLSQFRPVAADVPDFKDLVSEEYTSEGLDEEGIMLAALRFERKTEYLYAELARRADNETHRQFFDMLASYERGHYELIDAFLEYSTGFRMQT